MGPQMGRTSAPPWVPFWLFSVANRCTLDPPRNCSELFGGVSFCIFFCCVFVVHPPTIFNSNLCFLYCATGMEFLHRLACFRLEPCMGTPGALWDTSAPTSNPSGPWGTLGNLGPPMGPMGVPGTWGAQGGQEAPREPRRTPGAHGGTPQEPRGAQRNPMGPPGEPKAGPKGTQGGLRDKNIVKQTFFATKNCQT